MNIALVEPLMRRYGVSADQIQALRAAAAALPPDLLERPMFDTPPLPRLSMADSELLLARLLRSILCTLGLARADGDVLDMAGCPATGQLLQAADRRGAAPAPAAAGWSRRASDTPRHGSSAQV